MGAVHDDGSMPARIERRCMMPAGMVTVPVIVVTVFVMTVAAASGLGLLEIEQLITATRELHRTGQEHDHDQRGDVDRLTDKIADLEPQK